MWVGMVSDSHSAPRCEIQRRPLSASLSPIPSRQLPLAVVVMLLPGV